MGLPLTRRDTHFTYGDYRRWPQDERWELIDGVAYNMCAAPNLYHQGIAGELYRQIANFLRGKPCRVFIAPFDVLLPEWPEQDEDEVDTVVQPDIVVYCDRSKLTTKGSRGAPDLAVEVLSPWTSKKDLNEKFRLYQRCGVREYWVIDPGSRSLQFYSLEACPAVADRALAGSAEPPWRYGDPLILVGGGRVASQVLEGFTLELASLFEDLEP
jgi:Uma2 family endonuclease